MNDIKLRDIMDVTEKIKNGIEDNIKKLSIAEKILPSKLTLKDGPMFGNLATAQGAIDCEFKDIGLEDICNLIVVKASKGLSEEIDRRFMLVVENRTLSKFNTRTSLMGLCSKMSRQGELSVGETETFRKFINDIQYLKIQARDGDNLQSNDFRMLVHTLAEHDIAPGFFLVNSFIAAEMWKLIPASHEFDVDFENPFRDLTILGCPVIIPIKNEIVGDEIFLFAEKQFLGESKRTEVWLQINVTSNGIDWFAHVSYDFNIISKAVAISTLKDENDSN